VSTVVQILHHASDVAFAAEDLAWLHQMRAHPDARTLTIDYAPLDNARRFLNRSIDELRALGPEDLVPPALAFLDTAAAVYDAGQRDASLDELEPLARAMFDSKIALLEAIRAAGLQDI
jgi:hypothetical protein